jgi:hypothetical protein
MYNAQIDKKKALENNIDTLIKNDETIVARYIGRMIGGNFFTDDYTPQIDQLKTLFEEYNNLINKGSDQIAQNTEEIKKKSQSILESLDKINLEMERKIEDKKIEIERVVGPQSIVQDLDYLLLDLQKDGTTDGIYKRLIDLRTQRIPVPKMEEYIKFKSYIDTIKIYNSELKSDIENMDKSNIEEIEKIREKYNKISVEIKEYMDELDKLIQTYTDKNNEYIESMKTSNASIDNVVTFDPTNSKERVDNFYTEDLTNVNNSLFSNPELKQEVSDKIKHFFDPSGYTIHRNGLRQFKTMTITSKDAKEMLHLNKPGQPGQLGQSGGYLTELEKINVNFVILINEYKQKFKQYKQIFDEYNFLTLSIMQHLIYVLQVISTSIFETSNFSIFNFIGKGSINYYLRIIKKIIHDFSDPNTSKQPHVVEMRKKHYATIMILDNFLSQIIKKVDAKRKINFFKCGEEIQRNITLLNHFRIILDEFNSLNLGKVSIFSRINNLKFDSDNKNGLRMFMSDYEIKQQNIKQLTNDIIQTNLPDYVKIIEELKLEGQTEAIYKMIRRKSDFLQKIQLDQKYLSESGVYDNLMWVIKDPCNTYKNPNYNYINPLSSIKFTEVFDSTQFPGNDDISKYMQIASRLKDGYGVCLITYGYSGTGKTFTLFGDKGSTESPPINGLLQATLSELNGLEKVAFRVYELYGYGVPYTQYWINKQEQNKTRVDNIDSFLIKYKLQSGSGNIIEARYDTIIDNNDDIKKFIGKTKSKEYGMTDNYIVIDSITKIKDAFANFKLLTDGIDEIRKQEINDDSINKNLPPRIRDTPNNKESSRSIIIYEFKLTIKENGIDKTSTFLIVDLPGREDIAKTFVEPYQKPIIQKAITNGFNKLNLKIIKKDEPIKEGLIREGLKNSNFMNIYQSSNDSTKYIAYIKLLILAMTLNPMVVPVLAPQNFIEYIENSNNINIVNEIISKKLLTERYGAGKPAEPKKQPNEPSEPPKQIPIYADLTMAEEYINTANEPLSRIVNFITSTTNGKTTGKITPTDLKPIGYDDEFNKIQYKIVFSIHFMNRLLTMKKFDIIKQLYGKIINDKINIYIEEYINSLNIDELSNFITNAINENFKGEYLKLKLQTINGLESTFASFSDKEKLKNIINFFVNKSKIPEQSMPTDTELNLIRKTIFTEVKFNYDINGFEGIYINENIMGIVKYLKELSLDKGEVNNEAKLRADMEQDLNLGFAFQQKISRMLLSSNMVYTVGKDIDNDYNKIKSDPDKLSMILELEKLIKQKIKLDKQIKDIESDESTKLIKLVSLYKFYKYIETIKQDIKYEKLKEDIKQDKNPIMKIKDMDGLLESIKLKQSHALSIQNISDNIKEIFNEPENNKQFILIKYISDNLLQIEQKLTNLKRTNQISDAFYNAMFSYPDEMYGILIGLIGGKKDYSKLYDRLFNPGLVFRDKEIFDETFSRLNSGYQPDRIFTFNDPIIKNILSPYVDVDEVDKKSIVSDYKVFYLFANYGTEIEQVGQLKCANQNDLLITTRNFIESVTK